MSSRSSGSVVGAMQNLISPQIDVAEQQTVGYDPIRCILGMRENLLCCFMPGSDYMNSVQFCQNVVAADKFTMYERNTNISKR